MAFFGRIFFKGAFPMTNTRKLTTMAILTALSVCFVALIHFPIFPAVAFLEYDPADPDSLPLMLQQKFREREQQPNSDMI